MPFCVSGRVGACWKIPQTDKLRLFLASLIIYILSVLQLYKHNYCLLSDWVVILVICIFSFFSNFKLSISIPKHPPNRPHPPHHLLRICSLFLRLRFLPHHRFRLLSLLFSLVHSFCIYRLMFFFSSSSSFSTRTPNIYWYSMLINITFFFC